MICPHCGKPIEVNHAAELGRMKKTMSPAAIEARRRNLEVIKAKREGKG